MYIKREYYLETIRRYYDSNLIKVLTGVRRSGKSVLLSQIRDEILYLDKANQDHIIYINLEDFKFASLKNANRLNTYINRLIKDDKKYFIFIDEIQHVNQFERILASLKATRNVSLFITGSNSNLLSGKLATLLVGRCVEFKIMPFSYAEFIKFYQANNLSLPEEPLVNYLRYGGMPQRFDYSNEEDIKRYLKSIFYGIIDKDICNQKSKIDRDNFITIATYIISNVTKEFSSQRIVNFFNKNNDSEIYRITISRYLKKLEEACILSRVKQYNVSSKRILKKNEKQFVCDNGFILACSQTNHLLASHLLENAIYNEMVLRGYDVKIGKTYKGEIDFVVMKDGKKCFMQVAYLLSSEEVIEREFGAYKSVKDNAPKYVLSLDKFDMSADGIIHLNIEDWLLHKKDLMLF